MAKPDLRLEGLTTLVLPLTAYPLLTAYRADHVAPGEASLPAHITLYTPFIYADEFGSEQQALVQTFAASNLS